MSDLAEVMTKAERERRWPNVPPKDAATLIIIDRGKPEPRVLMGRRHHGHKFMPGKFVFPGGRIEAVDRFMTVASALHPTVAGKLLAQTRRPSLSRGRALALAAVRETFEETGLLVGGKAPAIAAAVPEGAWSAFVGQNVLPDLSSLHFVARAITPPRRPKRFDTRFFAVDAQMIAGEVGGIIGPEAELVELAWVSLDEATQLDLPTITRVVLKELAARTAAGFAPELPVPFYYERHKRFMREEL